MRLRPPVYVPLVIVLFFSILFSFSVLVGNSELSRAEKAFGSGDYPTAASYYQKAMVHMPWRIDLYDRAGRSIAGIDPEKSVEYLENARKHGTISPEGLTLLGGLYWGYFEDEEAASVIWQAGVEIFPEFTDNYYWLSLLYRSQGDYRLEQNTIEKWMAIENPEDAGVYYRLGLILSTSDPSRALEVLAAAESLDPEYEQVSRTMRTTILLASLEENTSDRFVVLGRGLGLVNEWSLAKMTFQQAIEVDSANPLAWAWLGEAKQQLGEDGSDEIDRAASLGVDDPDVHALLAVYHIQNTQYSEAVDEYRNAIKLDPGNPDWYIALAETLAYSGELSEAISTYVQALQIAPENAEYWRDLALLCANYNIYLDETGLPAAVQAVEIDEDDARSQAVLGWLYVKLFQTEDAEETLKLAIEKDPDLPDPHYYLGYLYLQNSRYTLAKEQLLLARDMAPTSAIGLQAQALLDEFFK